MIIDPDEKLPANPPPSYTPQATTAATSTTGILQVTQTPSVPQIPQVAEIHVEPTTYPPSPYHPAEHAPSSRGLPSPHGTLNSPMGQPYEQANANSAVVLTAPPQDPGLGPYPELSSAVAADVALGQQYQAQCAFQIPKILMQLSDIRLPPVSSLMCSARSLCSRRSRRRDEIWTMWNHQRDYTVPLWISVSFVSAYYACDACIS